MIFRLSQVLKARVKAGPLGTVPLHENPLLDWSAHLFPVGRTRVILISNTRSLLSAVVSGDGITSAARFQERAFDGIRACLESHGFESIPRTVIPTDIESVRFAKALNRSVSGSMNELIRFAGILLGRGELTLLEVAHQLNDTHLSALAGVGSRGYGKPSEAFRTMVNEIESKTDPSRRRGVVDSKPAASGSTEPAGATTGTETMAKENPRLKLGKRASFVKTHLKQLPQASETWEVDFRALPRPQNQTETHYLGVAVVLPKGDPRVYLPVQYTPNVNDLAGLLAEAMRRPLTGPPQRPERIHFRGNPRWEELFPHLKELGIEVTIRDELPELEDVCLDFLRQMRKARSSPIIMLSPRPTSADQQFPAIDKWVRENGWIEVRRRNEGDFVARALTDNGVADENTENTTIAEAMTALENGLSEWFMNRYVAG